MGEMIDTYRGYVNPWECDEMGHMNIQFYLGKTSDAAFHQQAFMGLGFEHQKRERTTYVALEHHIRFHQELFASDLVAVRSGVFSIQEKTMRIYQEVRNALADTLSATLVVDVGHFDMTTRKLTPWPDFARTQADKLLIERPTHADPRSQPDGSLDRDVSLARAERLDMGETNRSAVNRWECDSNDHMNARFYLARFSECQGHMWARSGLDRHAQKAKGLATATVEMRLAYFQELTAGQTLLVRTGLEAQGPKTLRYRHWMFNAETGDPVAAAEGTALLISRETRKAVPLPDEIRAQIG
ncbi:MAG: thioesterase family protein [Rhodobiaceae bacterium]|nr:thioesterase family protein [Rhodobiaceae bacterium]